MLMLMLMLYCTASEKHEPWVSADAVPAGDSLAKYSRDLTAVAREGRLDPVIGREEEIRRTIQVLSRRTKNNPVLIGEPGMQEGGREGKRDHKHKRNPTLPSSLSLSLPDYSLTQCCRSG